MIIEQMFRAKQGLTTLLFLLVYRNITQACDQKTFLTRVAVSYAFFRADNGKNSEKVPSRTIFAQISIFDFGTQWITTGC